MTLSCAPAASAALTSRSEASPTPIVGSMSRRDLGRGREVVPQPVAAEDEETRGRGSRATTTSGSTVPGSAPLERPEAAGERVRERLLHRLGLGPFAARDRLVHPGVIAREDRHRRPASPSTPGCRRPTRRSRDLRVHERDDDRRPRRLAARLLLELMRADRRVAGADRGRHGLQRARSRRGRATARCSRASRTPSQTRSPRQSRRGSTTTRRRTRRARSTPRPSRSTRSPRSAPASSRGRRGAPRATGPSRRARVRELRFHRRRAPRARSRACRRDRPRRCSARRGGARGEASPESPAPEGAPRRRPRSPRARRAALPGARRRPLRRRAKKSRPSGQRNASERIGVQSKRRALDRLRGVERLPQDAEPLLDRERPRDVHERLRARAAEG